MESLISSEGLLWGRSLLDSLSMDLNCPSLLSEFVFLFLIHAWRFAPLGKKSELEKIPDNKDNVKLTFHWTLSIFPHSEYQFSYYFQPVCIFAWIKLFSHMCMPV